MNLPPISPPLLNAAGSLGFAPDPDGPVDLSRFGAFTTNPISQGPRRAAGGQRLAQVPSGMLLHSGHPNPGLSAVLRNHAGRWAASPIPIIVHLLGGAPDETQRMVERLEEQENVMAIELGLPWDISPAEAAQMTSAALGELPLIVRLPLPRAYDLASIIMDAGAAAVSLGPARGAVPAEDDSLLHGQLYGPAHFPQALQSVEALARAEVPVIGAGGVYRAEDVKAMLEVGALAVTLDSVLWRGDVGPLLDGLDV